MFKNDLLNKIQEVGVVAVVRAENINQAIKISEACVKGGITVIEVTFTVPEPLIVIQELSKKFSDQKVLIGAGTVLNKKDTQDAIDAGASFIVSPGFNLQSAELCLELNVPYLPGCLTITEMMTAINAGAEIIKLFPGSTFGPSYIKAIKGPLPNIKIMPTGGVSLDNVDTWIKNGVVAVGVGGELTGPAKKGDYETVVENARKFVAAVKNARGL